MVDYDPENAQLPTDTDEVQCTRPMWQKFVRSAPSLYANSLAVMDWKSEEVPTVDEVAGRLWQYEENLSSSLVSACSTPDINYPTICHGLIQTALEKGEAPEHLQYIDDIMVWGNIVEVSEKGKKIIQILLKAGFAIKRSKVKGPAQEI
ncbi:hypothetical protein GRJ2_003212600 [Grus japonensis]|uniref:Reverse transcriptase n=1 Tax=Grus japonensis TaxID=30415 RepID=A0ABC9YCW8_GRUJA